MKPKKFDSEKPGQSYVGIGKLVIWAVVIVGFFLLKQCGFDVHYPTNAP